MTDKQLRKTSTQFEAEADKAEEDALESEVDVILELRLGNRAKAQAAGIRVLHKRDEAEIWRVRAGQVDIAAAKVEAGKSVQKMSAVMTRTTTQIRAASATMNMPDLSAVADNMDGAIDDLAMKTLTVNDAMSRNVSAAASSKDVDVLLAGLGAKHGVAYAAPSSKEQQTDLEERLRAARKAQERKVRKRVPAT